MVSESTGKFLDTYFAPIASNVFGQKIIQLQNFTGRWWDSARTSLIVPNPLTSKPLLRVPDTQQDELMKVIQSMKLCPPYGLHNPLYNRERYKLYGQICARGAGALTCPDIADYFARLINLVMPKGYEEAMAEVIVVRDFFYTLAGDGVRFLARGTTTPGDRMGQESCSYRWPYGPVAVISPFNFPLEIIALQSVAALVMGNKPLLKPDPSVAVVAEAFVRLLLDCGVPYEDICLLHAGGETTQHLMALQVDDAPLIRQPRIQMIQFTGSTAVAERLSQVTLSRVKREDSGFDWKVLGPNFSPDDIGTVARQCDQDAYAASGQKCSAQSFLIAHHKWLTASLFDRLNEFAQKRRLLNLGVGPTLTWPDVRIKAHVDKLCAIEGAYLIFGGAPEPHGIYRIPGAYGCYRPTAVFVPLDQIVPHFALVTTEVFAPVQIVTEWETQQDLQLVLQILNHLPHHLTAGIVDRNVNFVEYMLGRTRNATTYAGILGRTSGAPQWHRFGGGGHPAAAGIGTPEAIRDVWTYPREVIKDWGEYRGAGA